jgi:hypothetical protein
MSHRILYPSYCQWLLTHSHVLHRYVCSSCAGCATVLRSAQCSRRTSPHSLSNRDTKNQSERLRKCYNPKKKLGFITEYYFYNTFSHVYSEIPKEVVHCPDEPTCFIWAAVYHNISTIIHDLDMDIYRAARDWTDENNRPL